MPNKDLHHWLQLSILVVFGKAWPQIKSEFTLSLKDSPSARPLISRCLLTESCDLDKISTNYHNFCSFLIKTWFMLLLVRKLNKVSKHI